MKVLNELKPGLDEKLYERAMSIEMKRCGHNVTAQPSYRVRYGGELIGNLVPDLIVDDTVIVDSNVFAMFSDAHHRTNAGLPEHHWSAARITSKF
jgi:GxxExxY protein